MPAMAWSSFSWKSSPSCRRVALTSWFCEGLVETPSTLTIPTKKLATVKKRSRTPAVCGAIRFGLNVGEASAGK